MAFNGIMALILRYFTEYNSIALQADYVTVIEDRPITSAKYHLQVIFGQNSPTQQSHVLFVTAELFVAPHHRLVIGLVWLTDHEVQKFTRFSLLNWA